MQHGRSNGTILITDSIVVFKGSGHEDLAQELARAITSGDSQYDLDSNWGLTPIFDYAKLGYADPYYENDAFWGVFVDGIAVGGPESTGEELADAIFKSNCFKLRNGYVSVLTPTMKTMTFWGVLR